MEWISVKDNLPEHGQHVLVWDERNNVYPFPRDHPGDDGEGRVKMGDAVFWCGDTMWLDRAPYHNNSKEQYLSCPGSKWDQWEGQGPCDFDEVTHWMALPGRPK